MPRGFPDVESGSNLPGSLLPVAEELPIDLLRWRQAKNRFAGHPVTGAALARYYGHKHKLELSDVSIRAVVNYLRRLSYPIGSCRYGYFYAKSPRELLETHDQLWDRECAIRAARQGIERAIENMQPTLDIFEQPGISEEQESEQEMRKI